MTEYVADTHALFWYITRSERLGPAALNAFTEAEASHARIHVPAIVFAELFFLNVRLGFPLDIPVTLERLRVSPNFSLHAFTFEHVLDFASDATVPEMHDRIIVG